MFRINNTSNRIIKLKEATFAELGFTERHHLQEWLANQPDALGEELLIIQKEFDGFDDTRERLDLLAIDKQGNLVIIENKLDDVRKGRRLAGSPNMRRTVLPCRNRRSPTSSRDVWTGPARGRTPRH